jgi:hypothetical protein
MDSGRKVIKVHRIKQIRERVDIERGGTFIGGQRRRENYLS